MNPAIESNVPAPSFRTGLWQLADPKISITSAAAMMIGASAAAVEGHFHLGWLLVTGLALFCMEVAKNAWGDVIDYDSGTDLAVAPADRTSFSGGKRVMVDGHLTRRQTWAVAFVFGTAGIALGALIVFGRESQAFWIGIIGLVLGWSYHGPPLKLAYRGLGELDVVVCYGPLIVLATYLIQAGSLSWNVFWLSVPLGLLVAAFLWVNEFPDYLADRSAGKRNLIVRLGRRRASHVLPWIYVGAFGLLLALPWTSELPLTIELGLLAVAPASVAVWHTWQRPETFHRRDPVQPMALLAFVVYSLGVGIGLLAGDRWAL